MALPTPPAQAAPAAPAATPAPAPAPAPAATPAPSPGKSPDAPSSGADNPFADIDAKFAAADAPRKTTTGKAPEAGTPAAGKPAAGTPPKGAAKEPAELRKELDRLKGELATKNESYSALEKRIAEAEAKGKDTTVLTERLATMEKEIEKRDAELRALKHEASPDFKEKYEKPFTQAMDFAHQIVTHLVVTDPKTGTERQATWDDFGAIYAAPVAKQGAMARELYGEDAQTVINHIQELRRLDFVKNQALTEEREQYKKRQEQEDANRISTQQKLGEAWTKVNKDLSESVEAYRDPPEDKELADLRNEGLRIFDAPVSSPDQRIIKNAHIRQRVAAFGPNQLKITRLTQENADLKAQIETLKNGGVPGKVHRPGGGDPAGGSNMTWEEEARKTLS